LASRLLTLPKVADLIGVEYRTLHSWLKRGLLQPSHQSSSGTGVPNLFSLEDAVQAKVLADLRGCGIPLERLAEAAEKLGNHPRALNEGAAVVVNGSVVVIDEEQAGDMVQSESLTVVYNTKYAVTEIGSAVTADESSRA
jgi:DNA-binding transcriptional MerR regulator